MGLIGVRRVVVGVNTTPGGYEALRVAVGYARTSGATLVALRTFCAGSSTPPYWLRIEERTAREIIGMAFDEALGGFPTDLEINATSACGRPGRALPGFANQPGDLLVVGGPRRGWSFVRGRRVASECIQHACCPVIVVPPPSLATRKSHVRLGRTAAREAERFLRTVGDTDGHRTYRSTG